MLRFLLWRLLGVLAGLVGFALVTWLLHGGPGRQLRGGRSAPLHVTLAEPARMLAAAPHAVWRLAPGGVPLPLVALVVALALTAPIGGLRWRARRRRRYVRLRIAPYRTDHASAEAILSMYEALHKRLLRRWWRRALLGQPAVSLEVHYEQPTAAAGDARPGAASSAWLAVACTEEHVPMVEAALRVAYPNCSLRRPPAALLAPPALVRLKKGARFIERVKSLEHFEHEREPTVNRLLTAMGAARETSLVQLSLTPAPALFERFARHRFKAREARISRERRAHPTIRDRSFVEDSELRGGLDVQHRPLFFVELRVAAGERRTCERVASALRADGAENRLVERGAAIRHGLLSLYCARIERGEGNPLPSVRKGVYSTTELASIWHLPSVDYATVPLARDALPQAPAPPSIYRPRDGPGTLRDASGGVSIDPELRKQNTAVAGAVEQGKSSYLIATVAEDLVRERCAVIVLDPKGDAADAAVSLVPPTRTCTLLDFAHPTCGFNPLAVDAPADAIADYVVAALKNLFTDGDIRASSDRYLRNAIIAVLAYDRCSTLWDAARLLSVGEDGYAYRRAVGSHVRALPAYSEISQFFTRELTAQLADSRSTTTAKLDAPVNKLARLLNSASIKRVLLNDSLSVDLDRVIAEREVLVVRGALGAMGAGNTSVLMQLLVGMLDAALARQQDLLPPERRVAVALKVDEAPLVLNRGFADTMALKRSAGLETVACWQSDAQWTDREVREQLDALFAHRVYFATASTDDARAAVGLTMAEFSDTVRPGVARLGGLGRPDARLHLPKHHAIASWTTAAGRAAPFIAETVPLHVDRDRIALHAARQSERGGRYRSELRQPHWQRADPRDCDANGSPRAAEQLRQSPAARSAPPTAATEEPARAEVLGETGVSPGVKRRERSSCTAPLPDLASESYRELVELDLAQSVRWARRAGSRRALQPESLDLEMLELIARFEHVLSSQLHRHINGRRSITTTQRRLKRLSDADLVERFQFHRRDGGGVPMCYVISAGGRELLRSCARLPEGVDEGRDDASMPAERAIATGEQRLRRARHDVHVTGWVLALLGALATPKPALRGAREAVLKPPSRATPAGRVAFGPSDLRLPGGRVPHDFLGLDDGDEEQEVDRFDTIRPDAVVQLREPAIDVIVELEDRLASRRGAARLARYDHFLAGWSAHTKRYGRRAEARPQVVFVCRGRERARSCAQAADTALRACRAYAGEYPFDWEYPGRERILFVAERDVHECRLQGFGVPRLPPGVRVTQARGDPRAAEVAIEMREIVERASGA